MRPDDKLLADAFYPAMDPSSITEMDGYMVTTYDSDSKDMRRPINTDNSQDLREYVRRRQQRERVLVPVPTKKMDVSGVDQMTPGNSQLGEPAWEADQQTNNWNGVPWGGEPPPEAPWQNMGDLHALRNKGGKKGTKGSGKQNFGKSFSFHNCVGEGSLRAQLSKRRRGQVETGDQVQ